MTRQRVQAALVYFGLAEEPGSAPSPPNPHRDWFTIIVIPVFMVSAVAADRGGNLAALAAALFVPGVVVASRLGPLRAVHDHLGAKEDPLLVVPVMFAGALLIYPDRFGVWPPVALAAIASAAIIVAGRRARRRDHPGTARPA